METFTALKNFSDNPDFSKQKEMTLLDLKDHQIEKPIKPLINSFNALPVCFTLQSCFGHFVQENDKEQYNLNPLAATGGPGVITYKIAYIALCIENNMAGRALFKQLETIPAIDPNRIQFCCAQWFWDRQVNSFVLQVEPDRYKDLDRVELNFEEAKRVEQTRNVFFSRLETLLTQHS